MSAQLCRSFNPEQRAVLLDVSEGLAKEEVKKLLYLCPDMVSESAAEKIQFGYELFRELEKRERITSLDCKFLEWLLKRIKREDLVRKLSEVSETSAGEVSQEPLPVKKPRRHSLEDPASCTDHEQEQQGCDVETTRPNQPASCDEVETESAIQMKMEASDSAAVPEIIDERCMREAVDASQNSDDNNTKVGAVLVRPPDYTVISRGCNRFPKGCEGHFPISRDAADPADRKYPYIIYAIENCLHPEGCPPPDVRGCVAYTNFMPFGESAKSIVISGITEVVYLEDKYPDAPATRASRRLLRECGIHVRQYTPKCLPTPLLAE